MTPSIHATDLHFRYPSGFQLGPVQLELGPGLWHLRGHNGAGKTTLLRLLTGALAPTRGTLQVCGSPPHQAPAVRARIGYLPANPDLPDFFDVDEAWRFLATLRGQPDWDGTRLCEALKLPGQLRLSEARAGQRRKAELVAALAAEPSVLLLDEPFANVDAASVEVIRGWLAEWSAERVVLLVTHEAPGLPVSGSWELRAGEALVVP
jgi:ABC-2 type transport system ATP-binding protein